MIWLLVAACAVASVPAGLRWLRVAQREHYLPGAVSTFAWRWWRSTVPNNVLDLAATVGVIGSIFDIRLAYLTPAAQVGPIGLSVRGVTSPLAWTDRLKRLAGLSGVVVVAFLAMGGLYDEPVLVVLPVYLLPSVIDLALWTLRPYEKRRGEEWVDKATAKLRSVDPAVVAITGSYGKTTTKNYVAHLLAGSKRVVASPASFNNRMGLARAINENLAPGTEVFVAEMGTYGRGEIAELCEWIPPKVAAITAIGPVHLERFGSLENIVRAKSEVLDTAEVGVINIDGPLLAELASERRGEMRIVEVSANDVAEPDGIFAGNLAVALGIGAALGVAREDMAARVHDLPAAEHRQSLMTAGGGFTIIDDTFNSNPEGARSALTRLVAAAEGGRTAVITPGMVELGHLQDSENEEFAALASRQVDHLIIVGRTNRKALLRGSVKGKASVTVVGTRDEAVAWARDNLGSGDVVLYENDLPDHYP
ncbi:MAG TPA: UDP-N-acetylmuramoyl-tripeptide--D-alanyl-D-alanine ligase [Acidimicrobiia bacterium]